MSAIKVRLSEILGRHRVSQRQLAEQAGIRPATVGALYNERVKGIDFSTLAALLDALHTLTGERYTVCDLLKHESEEASA